MAHKANNKECFHASCYLGVFTFHMFYSGRKHTGIPNQPSCLKYNWSLLITTGFTQIRALICRIMHSCIFRSQRAHVHTLTGFLLGNTLIQWDAVQQNKQIKILLLLLLLPFLLLYFLFLCCLLNSSYLNSQGFFFLSNSLSIPLGSEVSEWLRGLVCQPGLNHTNHLAPPSIAIDSCVTRAQEGNARSLISVLWSTMDTKVSLNTKEKYYLPPYLL